MCTFRTYEYLNNAHEQNKQPKLIWIEAHQMIMCLRQVGKNKDTFLFQVLHNNSYIIARNSEGFQKTFKLVSEI